MPSPDYKDLDRSNVFSCISPLWFWLKALSRKVLGRYDKDRVLAFAKDLRAVSYRNQAGYCHRLQCTL